MRTQEEIEKEFHSLYEEALVLVKKEVEETCKKHNCGFHVTVQGAWYQAAYDDAPYDTTHGLNVVRWFENLFGFLPKISYQDGKWT